MVPWYHNEIYLCVQHRVFYMCKSTKLQSIHEQQWRQCSCRKSMSFTGVFNDEHPGVDEEEGCTVSQNRSIASSKINILMDTF